MRGSLRTCDGGRFRYVVPSRCRLPRRRAPRARRQRPRVLPARDATGRGRTARAAASDSFRTRSGPATCSVRRCDKDCGWLRRSRDWKRTSASTPNSPRSIQPSRARSADLTARMSSSSQRVAASAAATPSTPARNSKTRWMSATELTGTNRSTAASGRRFTYEPEPRRETMSPSSRKRANASLTTGRDAPKRCANSVSDGSRASTAYCPPTMRSKMRAYTPALSFPCSAPSGFSVRAGCPMRLTLRRHCRTWSGYPPSETIICRWMRGSSPPMTSRRAGKVSRLTALSLLATA